MTRLVVTADAEADINDILDYLAEQAGASVAFAYGRKFRSSIDRLIEFPGIGVRRPALGANIRIVIVPPYILIYDYVNADDVLTLLRVVHGKRAITHRLIRRV